MALNDTITALGNSIINLIDKKTPIATANTVGMVKPDGSTINIDANGVISSNGGGGSGLEVCDIGMTLYVDESKGLRRYLNGQVVERNTNTDAFFTRLQQITTLHPSLLDTEENWQAEKTLSKFGQVGKFVFNYSGDEIVSVRLPRVVNVQGLFDLQNLGMTVAESLPNITGNISKANFFDQNITWDGAFDLTYVDNYTYPGGNVYKNNYKVNFNASNSSSTYQDNAPVQQEAIQYPYFIQIATGSETENNIINEIELNNPYSLFDSKYSDHELNNLSWLKSEGQWNAKAVYPSAYDELLREYNDSASVEETEGSITFKRTPKGYKIALAEQDTAITEKYTNDGIAWYYILDTENTQFKLPRTKFGFEGLRDKVGDDIAESLPNITGRVGGFCGLQIGAQDTMNYIKGAFYKDTSAYSKMNYNVGDNANALGFNASLSSSTYQDGAPVQERATQMYLYFYVGETVQNANLIDAGRIGEQLANKQDKCIHITETYQNGSSWYRVWSDGWCEQGGRISVNQDKFVIVTFLKPFMNASYYANWISCDGVSINGQGTRACDNLTTTSMRIYNGQGCTMLANWTACGYIA